LVSICYTLKNFKQKLINANFLQNIAFCDVHSVQCVYTIKLLFISFQDDIIIARKHGIPIIIDIGSKNTFLESELYDSLINLVCFLSTLRILFTW